MTDAVRSLKPGEYLFLQGEIGHELYFLKSGALEVVLSPSKPQITADDVNKHGTVIERFDTPGQLIGEISPILNCPRTASIRAATECSLQAADMRQGAFESAVRGKPLLGIKIAEELSRRINRTNERLKKHDMRLLRFLEEVRVALDGFAGGACDMDALTQQAAGNVFLETCRLSRMLNTFPPDLPISLALPYDHAGAFFAFFGGVAFQTPAALTHATSAADALAKVQGKKFSAGATLCSSGEEAKELYILLEGRLDVVVGRRTIQTIRDRGSMVGEMAFLLKTRRTASVVAVVSSTVLMVPFEKMEPLFARVPQLLFSMLRQLALRLLQIDSFLQKSIWRNIFFGEVLPAFVQAVKSSVESLPSGMDEAIRTSAQKSASMIEEAAAVMSKAGAQDSTAMPFTLSELVSSKPEQAETSAEDLTETPPGQDAPGEHVDFAMSLTDKRCVFGPPRTPRERFATYLHVDPQTLMMGRINGKVGQTSTYAEIQLDSDLPDDGRIALASQIASAIGVSHILMEKPPQQWLYYQEGSHSGAVSADAIPHADKLLESVLKLERASMTLLDRSRSRRLYLEAVTSALEAHWNAPGKFTDLTPTEIAMVYFGAMGPNSEKHKLDIPSGHTFISIVDFAKRVVVQLAGGESALMGDVESAKAKLPEKEKQIADLIETWKKAYADQQIPYDDKREGPILQQLEKMTHLLRLKDKGKLPADALRDFAAAEKETGKMLDERNTSVNQKLKGDAGRKALQQIKGIEDQLRTAYREKADITELIQSPPPDDDKKDKNAAVMLPINLLNGFRDAMLDLYACMRQTIQSENKDVAPIMTEDIRLYAGRDVGIALQKILERDKLLPSIGEMPPILRVPGEGYSVYLPEWDVLVVPLYLDVDSFQLMANGVGEWRWSKVAEADRKKYQKTVKGGSVKLDQLGTYFSRDYRMLLDDKETDDACAKFVRDVMNSPGQAAAAPAPAAKSK